jgi:hypothetical protein
MGPGRLAVELSSRMEEGLPPGFTVTVEGDMLYFLFDGERRAGSHACQWVDSGQDSLEGLAVQACELALNDLQDFVTEKTTEPWPATEGPPPQPGARLVGRTIEMWFGSLDQPVTLLRPLALEG